MEILSHRYFCQVRKTGVILILCLFLCESCIQSRVNHENDEAEENWEKEIAAAESFNIDDIHFEALDLQGVLSDSLVYSILQDHLGFMWFGTQIGLAKYDGYETTIYRNDPRMSASLSDDSIYAIHEDRDGGLWIGTRSGGLNYFDRKKEAFRAYRHRPDDPTSLSHDQVYAIYEDDDGTLWIGTRDGLNRLDREQETFTVFRGGGSENNENENNVIHAITQTHSGSLWVAAGSRLAIFDLEKNSFRYFSDHLTVQDDTINPMILSLYAGQNKKIWVGTENGLRLFDLETENFEDVDDFDFIDGSGVKTGVQVNTIYQDQFDNVWIGSLDNGLFVMNEAHDRIVHYDPKNDDAAGLTDHMILSVYQDTAGNIWIGTRTGIDYFDPNARKFNSYRPVLVEDAPGSDTINALACDGSNGLWIGTANSGLEYLNLDTRETRQYRFDIENPGSLPLDKIWSLLVDQNGILWVGTGGGGFSMLNPDRNSFTHFRHDEHDPQSLMDDYINCIFQDSSGAIWLATNAGLDRYDPIRKRFTHYRHQEENPDSLSEYRPVALYEDHLRNLWVGTWGGGLYMLDLGQAEEIPPDDVKFIHYENQPHNPNSLSNNNVFSLLVDHHGILWVGTQGGLNRFDRKSAEFSVYGKEHGLPSNIIVGILEEVDSSASMADSRLWLSTDGLSSFDPARKKFTNYSVHDGLASNNSALGAYASNSRGEMFFGTTSGITWFNPDSIHENAYIPPIVLTDFQLYNQSVEISENSPLQTHVNLITSLELNHTDRVITFKYAALNYTESEKNQYAYMLEGLDTDWIDAGSRRSVTYTTLPPGSYTLHIRGSNNDAVWNEKGLSLDILVKPPWWQTWWAYGLYILGLVGFVAGYNHYRLLEKNRRLSELEEQVSARTTDLRLINQHLQNEIRERQRAEQNLQTLNQELENRVDERTARVRQLSARLAETEEVERQKIAAELHDQVSQNLVAMRVKLEILRNGLDEKGLPKTVASDYIEDTRQMVEQTSRCIRSLMDDLRPPALEDFGLLAALRWNSEQLSRRYTIPINVLGNPHQPRPSAALETALFRIAQEATINAIRHSQASHIRINLQQDSHLIRLVIQDDGVGFDLKNPPLSSERQHRGLQIMTERAEAAGGNFRIESAKGKGVTITVEVVK